MNVRGRGHPGQGLGRERGRQLSIFFRRLVKYTNYCIIQILYYYNIYYIIINIFINFQFLQFRHCQNHLFFYRYHHCESHHFLQHQVGRLQLLLQ